MNVIKATKKILSEYDKISEFSNGIQIDFTTNEPTNFGLSSIGDTLLKEDILGNQKRKHSFVLYAVNQAYEDYDRLANSGFLLELSYWLENQKGQAIDIVYGNTKKTGEITKITTANAMIYSVPTGNINDGVMYQVQIYVEYKVKGEN